jgi:pimeloyl-ACP methyl ester carboxylesterase
MVVANSGVDMVVRTPKQLFTLIQRSLIMRLLGMQKLGEVLSNRLFPKQEQLELRQAFTGHWAQNDPRAYREALKAIVGWSVVDYLKDISIPTLVICADQDYSPVDVHRNYAARIPKSLLTVIEDSRHATSVDQPEKFNQAVVDFLAGQ